LTHEVENSGDGSATQQSEVQTVTFNAGRGLGGTATLTYNDLYGQSWTTRPFAVGGDHVYRLEIAVVPDATSSNINFKYNGAKSANVEIHDGGWATDTATITTETIRAAVVSVLDSGSTAATAAASGLGKPFAGNDRASVVYVSKHTSATSAKLGGSIYASSRITFDIYIPIDMSTHDDNGALLNGLSVIWSSTPTANTASLALYNVGDRSYDIKKALTSLPNQVIPSVSVTKVDITDPGTTSSGATGNAYAQSYSITFTDEANSGDQQMLQCNAAPCDESGCINRGPGVSETRYMYHSHSNHGEGINFNNRGYFIMDIGANTAASALSAGTIRIMWDTGAGISSAEFAVVATAAEVQTALRTITGWESVSVALVGSRAAPNTATTEAAKLLVAHQFKVTFAAGYDDLGKSPTFKTLSAYDGNYAAATNNPVAKLYDQRFSNSVWIGKTSGYAIYTSSGITGVLNHVGIASGDGLTAIAALPDNGDVWKVSDIFFGAGGATTNAAPATGYSSGANALGTLVAYKNAAMTSGALESHVAAVPTGSNFAYLHEGATSQQSSDYFAVGSAIEVVGTNVLGDRTTTPTTTNKHRRFKVTGHVTNPFNKEFAKLDSFPSDETVTDTAGTFKAIDYLLKITSNNGTVHTYENTQVTVHKNEVQILTIGDGGTNPGTDEIFKLQYKGEESADLSFASTASQVAEEINSFSHLSGPVTVALTTTNGLWTITFDEKDGDVALLTVVQSSGAETVNTYTKHNGWSIEAPVRFGLDSMHAGGKVNITAVEVCTFTLETNSNGAYYFCYDGVCGDKMAGSGTGGLGVDASDFADAIESVLDDNGDAILSGVAVDATTATAPAISMPLGKSCDGLEMRVSLAGATDSVKKEVAKNNNGKQFGITRSFMQRVVPGTVGTPATGSVAITEEAALYSVVKNVDSLIIGDLSTCNAKSGANGDITYPINRDITRLTPTGATSNIGIPIAEVTVGAGTISTAGVFTHDDSGAGEAVANGESVWIHSCSAAGETKNNGHYRISGRNAGTSITLVDFDTGAAHAFDTTAATGCKAQFGFGIAAYTASSCATSIGRHVITLDAMPDASVYSITKSLEYTSPVGSCSVSETTKGTYESYECSNRGACDGKSGLCTCYEGYSGQSCQTQTVLV
jgi:hypothetical protein